jgi:serine/threonine protein kinase
MLSSDPDKYRALQQEAWVQGKLSHPNVVSVFDFAIVGKEAYMVMEYVEKPLHEILRECSAGRKTVPLDFALRAIGGCMEGLAHAHYLTVIHGDIKPANILVTGNKDAKLSDFGVARLLGTPAAQKEGSARWAAPEVLRTWQKQKIWACDQQSDLFSLGVVSYLLLTGKHPFIDLGGVLSIEEVILTDQITPEFPTREGEVIPERYARMVMRLIQRDKRKRYVSAEEALGDLQEYPMASCSHCEGQNPEGANFCNWCGKDLSAERKARMSPMERSLLAAHDFFTSGENEKGLAKIEEFLGSEKNTAEKWCGIGYNLNNNGWYKDAAVVCAKAIELNPNHAPSYQTRGFAKSNLGDLPGAIDDFTKALEYVDPENVVKRSQIYYQRGYAYMSLGKKTDACKDATESARLNPAYDRAEWLVRLTCKK